MFKTLIHTIRQRIALIQSLDHLIRTADDRLLNDIGLTRHDVRVIRQEVPGLLAMRSAAPGSVRLIAA